MMKSYSVWLVPKETEETRELQELIHTYSERYETPTFKPHITLANAEVGRERAQEVCRKLASQKDPFKISLSSSYCSTNRTRCFFLLTDPSKELLNFHKTALSHFEKKISPYFPHLSLAYGDIPLEERVNLVKSFDETTLPLEIKIGNLELIEVEGTSNEWESVDKFIQNWEKVNDICL